MEIERRAIQRQAAEMQQEAQVLVDKVMSQSGGSASRGLAAADAAINEISDYNLQASTALLNEDLAQALANQTAAQTAYYNIGDLVETSAAEQLDRIDAQYQQVLDGYLQNLNGVLAANTGALNQYGSEMEYITQQQYQSIILQMGVEQAAINNAWTEIDAAQQMIMNRMNVALSQWDIKVDADTMDLAMQQYIDSTDIGVFDWVTALAPVVTSVATAVI
jgi:hypothetical protein